MPTFKETIRSNYGRLSPGYRRVADFLLDNYREVAFMTATQLARRVGVDTKRAFAENRILITNDQDFGKRIFREGWPHRGVILLRLRNAWAASKIDALERLRIGYPDQLVDHFIVVTETAIRIASA
ncbi:MAG: hypothetical protein C4309_02860 [Chloroflexota bacterium]